MKWSRAVVVGAVFLTVGLFGATVAFGVTDTLEDDFTGTNGAAWDPAIWTDYDLANGQSTIQGNEGQLEVTGTTDALARQLADDRPHSDFEAVFQQRFGGGFDEDKRFGFEFRRSSEWASSNPDAPQTGYQLHNQQATDRVVLYRFDDGDETVLDQSGGITNTQTYWFKVQANGDSIRVKWWQVGATEPGSWNFDVTDDNYLTGEAFSFTHWRGDGSGTRQAIIDDLEINVTNNAPVAVNDDYDVDEDVQLVVAAPGVLSNDSDVDGDSLSASVVTGPVHGTLDLDADGGFSYTPDPEYSGGDSFTYQVSDGEESDQATVAITVNAVNDPPVAVNDSYETDEDEQLVVAAPGVLDNDSDAEGDPLTASVVDGPASGDLVLDGDGSFTYTPDSGFSGSDSFTYTANDGAADSNAATVAITVNEAGPGPGPEPEPEPSFVDIGDSIFEQDILWLAQVGITRGCNPPTNDEFCPNDNVTRGQMAAFFVRALDLTDRLDDPFVDDNGNTFEADIERLAAADITRGCNPPTNDEFCPNDNVTRGQMAAFFHRAADLLGLPD